MPRPEHVWVSIWVLVGILLIVLAGLVGLGKIDSRDAVVVAALCFAAGALFVAVAGGGRQFWPRLKSVSLGPFAFELLAEAASAARDTTAEEPPTEDDTSSAEAAEHADDDRGAATDAVSTRLQMERKLTWIAKHLLDEGGSATFLTIGSLSYDGYLTEAQARLASRLMTLQDEDLAALPANARAAFMRDADKLVSSLRATVFSALVRKRLTELGWTIETLARGSFQPDLLIERDGRRLRLAPLFTLTRESKLLKKTIDRLKTTASKQRVDRRIVVIPDSSRSELGEVGDDPIVTKLRVLDAALDA